MKNLRIRPEKSGLATSLFDLEAEIMELVWEWEAPFSVSDIHKKLESRRQIAYTTVMTTVSRLFDKGLLGRKKEGKRYIYTSKMSRDAFVEATTRQVMESLPQVGKDAAIAYLVEQIADADEDELNRLEALIQSRREQK